MAHQSIYTANTSKSLSLVREFNLIRESVILISQDFKARCYFLLPIDALVDHSGFEPESCYGRHSFFIHNLVLLGANTVLQV